AKSAFDPDHVRLLIPTAGGKNTLGAASLAFGLAKNSDSPVEVLHISGGSSIVAKFWALFVRDPARKSLEDHLATMKRLANGAKPPNIRRITSRAVSASIVDEAQKGYDVIVMGATERRSSVIEDVVESAPCHVAIVRTVGDGPSFERILVPIDGGLVSRV